MEIAWKVAAQRTDGTWIALTRLYFYESEARDRLRETRHAYAEEARRRDYGQQQDTTVLGLQRFEVRPVGEPEIVP